MAPSPYTPAQLDDAALTIAREAAPDLPWSPCPAPRTGVEARLGTARVSIHPGQHRVAGLFRSHWTVALDLPASRERVIHREPATPAGALATLKEVVGAARAYDAL